VDRRRILFAASLATVAGTVLVVAGAASCGAWGETMLQLALTQLGEPDGPEEI
jgi:hypothetical protein